MEAEAVSLLKFDKKQPIKANEFRFITCLKKAPKPITEDFIINYYIENIHRNQGQLEHYSQSKEEWSYSPIYKPVLKSMALTWFDRNLGKCIRKGILKP